jgi:hypothetical protein
MPSLRPLIGAASSFMRWLRLPSIFSSIHMKISV